MMVALLDWHRAFAAQPVVVIALTLPTLRRTADTPVVLFSLDGAGFTMRPSSARYVVVSDGVREAPVEIWKPYGGAHLERRPASVCVAEIVATARRFIAATRVDAEKSSGPVRGH